MQFKVGGASRRLRASDAGQLSRFIDSNAATQGRACQMPFAADHLMNKARPDQTQGGSFPMACDPILQPPIRPAPAFFQPTCHWTATGLPLDCLPAPASTCELPVLRKKLRQMVRNCG